MQTAFRLPDTIALLSRTPSTLNTFLRRLPSRWVAANEGSDSWSAFDIVGHLVIGERADWMPRAKRILEHGEAIPFDPFDRFAQEKECRGKCFLRYSRPLLVWRRPRMRPARTIAVVAAQIAASGTWWSSSLVRTSASSLSPAQLARWWAHLVGAL
jgi:hypothetical protein